MQAWIEKDPVDRLGKYLRDKGMLTSQEEARLQQALHMQVAAAVEAYENVPKQKPEDIFAYTYAQPTEQLKEQMEELKGEEK